MADNLAAERTKDASDNGGAHWDSFRELRRGVYLVSLDSARVGGEPLYFRPGANLVSGLTPTASRAVWQSIVGVEQGTNEHLSLIHI